jgi:hypothetical protein
MTKQELSNLQPGDKIRALRSPSITSGHILEGNVYEVHSLDGSWIRVARCSKSNCEYYRRNNNRCDGWGHQLFEVVSDPITEEEAKNAQELPDISDVRNFFK